MTAPTLRLAAALWRATHEALHGELSNAEAALVNEALSFVITCAAVEDTLEGLPAPGTPYHSELVADSQKE